MVAQNSGALVEGIEPEGDLETTLFAAVFEELLRLFGLDTQGLYPVLKLGDNIAQAKEVFFGMIQLAFRLGLTITITRDTCGFFKDLTSILGF